MSNTVAILQSNYIPWKGYFDIISRVDLFVFADDLQYTKEDWRNRNFIKTENGTKWLTIPCGQRRNRLICEVQPADSGWQQKHWRILLQEYAKAEHFERYRDFLEDFYLNHTWTNLSELNHHLIRHIAGEILGLETRFDDSRRYNITSQRADYVFDLLKAVEATHYVSGPSGQNYLHPDRFEQAGIGLTWMDYSGYPEYQQFHPPFIHQVSVLDLLFHEGPHAMDFINRDPHQAATPKQVT
jgi:hypothetical protein